MWVKIHLIQFYDQLKRSFYIAFKKQKVKVRKKKVCPQEEENMGLDSLGIWHGLVVLGTDEEGLKEVWRQHSFKNK